MPTTDMEFDGEAIAGGIVRWAAMESPSYDLTGASLIKASIVGANLEQALSFGPTLGYRSPCDCLDIQAAASWSVDRDLPDVGLQLRIR